MRSLLKRMLTVTLCVLFALSVLSVAASAADADLRLVVASDLHFNFPREEIEGPEIGSIDDPLFWYANRRAAGLVNGVLRACARGMNDVVYPDPKEDPEAYLEETRKVFARTWAARDGEIVTMRYPKDEEPAWISLF